ncbi:cytochrome P450 [Phlyctema vagabunda]|uniref:Cytochrome P450 n=1 Tax=Phlyctema vagabunda TaxID=108571 RepID=A0ABR4P2E9_9HELO
MISMFTLGVVIIGSLFCAIYKFIIHPLFLSPLSKIPAPHWSCHVSSLWNLWLVFRGPENKTIYRAHKSKGPILRIAPEVLSVNNHEGLKTIYGGGFEKPGFYAGRFSNYGLEPMFAMQNSRPHSVRKRMLANIFSKSNILTSTQIREGTRAILSGRFLPALQSSCDTGEPIEISRLSYAYAVDSFTWFQFGRSLASNMMQDLVARKRYLDAFYRPRPYLIYLENFPRLSSWVTKLGIPVAPAWIHAAFAELENWNLNLCDKAEVLLAESETEKGKELEMDDIPAVYAQMRQAIEKMEPKLTPADWPQSSLRIASPPQLYRRRLEIATEMFDLNAAAQETSGITLIYTYYQLSQRPDLMARLREELLSLDPPLLFPSPAVSTSGGQSLPLPDAKALDALPILNAIITETLRLYPAVPGAAPRVTPLSRSGTTLAGYPGIPGGITVQASAYTLHRNEDVFPNPEEWRPERWLDASPAHLTDMYHWFWAFGSGGRMCIGKHFGDNSIRFALAAVYTNFTTELVGDYAGRMEQKDGFIGGPGSDEVFVRFHQV